MNKIKILGEYTAINVKNEAASFFSEQAINTFAGTEWALLLPFLNGQYNKAEIKQQLADVLAAKKIHLMLLLLEKQKIIQTVDLPVTEPQLRISLSYLGEHDKTLVEHCLQQANIQIDSDAAIHVVITDDYLRPELEAINQQFYQQNKPWLLAKIKGSELRIGPLFEASSSCWQCFASRWLNRSQARRYLNQVSATANSDNFIVPPLMSRQPQQLMAMSFLANLIEQFYTQADRTLLSQSIWSYEQATGFVSHHLVKRPQCPVCGEPNSAIPQPILALNKAIKVSHQRTSDPLLLWEKFQYHISPVSGFIDELTLYPFDEQTLCYKTVQEDPIPLKSPLDLISRSLPINMGKGATHLQARLSALAEALERITLNDERPLDYCRSSYSQLGREAIDPRSCVLFSDAQYADPSLCSQQAEMFERVPKQRFDPNEVIGWTAGWSLTENRSRLVASDYNWLTSQRDSNFCYSDTSGCAAGACIEEAIIYGLYELIERDSIAIWWYNQLNVQAIDIESFADPYLIKMKTHHHDILNRTLWVLNLTSDLGIPTFGAFSALNDAEFPEFLMGFGCHLDPNVALRQAYTELNQMLALEKPYLTVPGVDNPWTTDAPLCISEKIEHWLRNTRYVDQAQLQPSKDMPLLVKDDIVNACSDDIKEDILYCVDHLAKHDIEVIAFDLTRPDIKFPIARVVAPGLRHFWRQLAPGRLYDVPVKMGFLKEPKTEQALNPVSIFL